MKKNLPQKWNLDVLFSNGSESTEFAKFLDQLETDITALHKLIEVSVTSTVDQFSALLDKIQNISIRVKHAGSFVSCLTAQNVKDEQAKLVSGRVKTVSASYAAAMTKWEEQLLTIDDVKWQELLTDSRVKQVAFPLNERRRRAKEKLAPELEVLANDLAIDGYHGWQDLYNTVVGRITIPFEQDGEVRQLSVGQASNMMLNHDRKVREQVFGKWQEAWANEAELVAQSLNHLAGFRLQLYRHRGWESVLQEPMEINRMSEETLNAMWQAIENRKDRLLAYLQRKAKLLGLEKLSWYDVSVSIGSETKPVSYDEAAEFIVEHFRRFNPKMAEFTEKAFEEGWIEAEDRPGKRPGGFCTTFPVTKQSRIFMTYAGNMSNVSTLAHELGHAYHQQVMNELPPMVQNYAMNVAETASTFAEMIVADAAVKNASNDDERLVLLEDKIERVVSFFMNIHSRFIFEKNFYEARKKGLVSAAALNELMVSAQKEAFRDALAEYDPHFWANKLHFYITTYPFYNFPYTFGYLFSMSVYARALEEGPSFAEKYDALLRDTANMTVEELAQRHLGVDITKTEFWQAAVDLAVADIEEFLRLT